MRVRGDLPDDKGEILQGWLDDHLTTLGAFLEAFADEITETSGETRRMQGRLPRIVARAQEITVERRKRNR